MNILHNSQFINSFPAKISQLRYNFIMTVQNKLTVQNYDCPVLELVLSPINDPVQNSLSHKLLQFHIKQKLILHNEVALAIANEQY